MTDTPADESPAQTEPATQDDTVETAYVNGGYVESPTPNAHVVGVTIIEGSGDPQAAG